MKNEKTKLCKKCCMIKKIDNFRLKKVKGIYVRYYICRECEKKEYKAYREKNKKILSAKMKKWRQNNKEHIKEYNEEWEKANREYRLDYHKQYRINHIEERRILDNKCKARRKKNDAVYKLKCQVRTMISDCFKRKQLVKPIKTEKILGCNYEAFINHLLQTYRNNYGTEWDGIEKVHIDHKTPLATAKSKQDVINLCHYTNLQLLKAHDNLIKGSKLNWKLEENYE